MPSTGHDTALRPEASVLTPAAITPSDLSAEALGQIRQSGGSTSHSDLLSGNKLNDLVSSLSQLDFQGDDLSDPIDCFNLQVTVLRMQSDRLREICKAALAAGDPALAHQIDSQFTDKSKMNALLPQGSRLQKDYQDWQRRIDQIEPFYNRMEQISDSRLPRVQAAIDDWAKRAGLPPVPVGAGDDPDEGGHYGGGKIVVARQSLLQNGPLPKDSIATIAHEMVHYEQDVTLVRLLADRQKISGSTCSPQERQTLKAAYASATDFKLSDDLLDRVLLVRNGKELAPNQKIRAEQLEQAARAAHNQSEFTDQFGTAKDEQFIFETAPDDFINCLRANVARSGEIFGPYANEAQELLAGSKDGNTGNNANLKASFDQLFQHRIASLMDSYQDDIYEQEAFEVGRQANLDGYEKEAEKTGLDSSPEWQSNYSIARDLSKPETINKIASNLKQQVPWDKLSGASDQAKGKILTEAVQTILRNDLTSGGRLCHSLEGLQISLSDRPGLRRQYDPDKPQIEIPVSLLTSPYDTSIAIGSIYSNVYATVLKSLDGLSNGHVPFSTLADPSVEFLARRSATLAPTTRLPQPAENRLAGAVAIDSSQEASDKTGSSASADAQTARDKLATDQYNTSYDQQLRAVNPRSAKPDSSLLPGLMIEGADSDSPPQPDASKQVTQQDLKEQRERAKTEASPEKVSQELEQMKSSLSKLGVSEDTIDHLSERILNEGANVLQEDLVGPRQMLDRLNDLSREGKLTKHQAELTMELIEENLDGKVTFLSSGNQFSFNFDDKDSLTPFNPINPGQVKTNCQACTAAELMSRVLPDEVMLEKLVQTVRKLDLSNRNLPPSRRRPMPVSLVDGRPIMNAGDVGILYGDNGPTGQSDVPVVKQSAFEYLRKIMRDSGFDLASGRRSLPDEDGVYAFNYPDIPGSQPDERGHITAGDRQDGKVRVLDAQDPSRTTAMFEGKAVSVYEVTKNGQPVQPLYASPSQDGEQYATYGRVPKELKELAARTWNEEYPGKEIPNGQDARYGAVLNKALDELGENPSGDAHLYDESKAFVEQYNGTLVKAADTETASGGGARPISAGDGDKLAGDESQRLDPTDTRLKDDSNSAVTPEYLREHKPSLEQAIAQLNDQVDKLEQERKERARSGQRLSLDEQNKLDGLKAVLADIAQPGDKGQAAYQQFSKSYDDRVNDYEAGRSPDLRGTGGALLSVGIIVSAAMSYYLRYAGNGQPRLPTASLPGA